MSLSEKCNANKKKLLQIKMDLKTQAQFLITVTSAGAEKVIEEGGDAAREELAGIGQQIKNLQDTIARANKCTLFAGVLRFVDGIAVAIILVTILQTLRSKHRFIPAVANDAFNKLGNLIGVPKHSADVMRHLKQLGMMFVGVFFVRMIGNAIMKGCLDKVVEETIVLKRMVARVDALKRRVGNIVAAVNDARNKAASGNDTGSD